MRLTPSGTVDHVDLNRSFRRPSSSHEERILRRNLPPASFCENFVLAVFSTFSTKSTQGGGPGMSALAPLLRANQTSAPRARSNSHLQSVLDRDEPSRDHRALPRDQSLRRQPAAAV